MWWWKAAGIVGWVVCAIALLWAKAVDTASLQLIEGREYYRDLYESKASQLNDSRLRVKLLEDRLRSGAAKLDDLYDVLSDLHDTYHPNGEYDEDEDQEKD